jgi:hypothetical protein
MKNTKHTLTPLKVDLGGYGFYTADGCSYDNCGHYGKKDAELRAMAKFFVRAVNSHDALMKAGQMAADLLGNRN